MAGQVPDIRIRIIVDNTGSSATITQTKAELDSLALSGTKAQKSIGSVASGAVAQEQSALQVQINRLVGGYDTLGRAAKKAGETELEAISAVEARRQSQYRSLFDQADALEKKKSFHATVTQGVGDTAGTRAEAEAQTALQRQINLTVSGYEKLGAAAKISGASQLEATAAVEARRQSQYRGLFDQAAAKEQSAALEEAAQKNKALEAAESSRLSKSLAGSKAEMQAALSLNKTNEESDRIRNAAAASRDTAATTIERQDRLVNQHQSLVRQGIADERNYENALKGRIFTLNQVGETESSLDRLLRDKVITLDQQALAVNKLTIAEKALVKAGATGSVALNGVAGAGRAVAKDTKVASEAIKTLGVTAGEVVSGNFYRLRSSLISLANRSGLLAKVFTPLGGAITLTVAAIITFTAALIKGAIETTKFNKALASTGDYAGQTAASIHQMAADLAGSSASIGVAKETLLTLVASGKITGAQLREAGQAAIDFGNLTGEGATKAAEQIIKLRTDPLNAVKALDEQYHFLTLAQYTHIEALVKAGQAEQASDIAQHALAESSKARLDDVTLHLGYMERAAHGVRNAFSSMWDAVEHVGVPETNASNLEKINKQLDHYRERIEIIRKNTGSKDTSKITDQDLLNGPETELGQHSKVAALLKQKQLAQIGATFEGWVAASKASNTEAETQLKKNHDESQKVIDAGKKDSQLRAEAEQRDLDAAKLRHEQNTKLQPNSKAENDKTYADEQLAIHAKYDKKNAGGDVGGAQRNASVDEATKAIAGYKLAFTNTQKELDSSRKTDLISQAEYFKQSAANIDQLEINSTASLVKEKNAIAGTGKNAAQRLKVAQQVKDIDNQIVAIGANASTARKVLSDQDSDAADKHLKKMQALQAEYDSLTGHSGRGAAGRIDAKYADDLGSAKVNNDQKEVDLIVKLKGVAEAKAGLDDLEKQAQDAFSQQALTNSGVQTQLEAHMITQGQAQNLLHAAYQQTLEVVTPLVPQMQALAIATGNPANVQAVERLNQELEKTRLITDQITTQLTGAFQSDIQNTLDSLGTKITNLHDLFNSFFLDILKNVQKIIDKQITDSIIGKLTGGAEGEGKGGLIGLLSTALGGNPKGGSGGLQGGAQGQGGGGILSSIGGFFSGLFAPKQQAPAVNYGTLGAGFGNNGQQQQGGGGAFGSIATSLFGGGGPSNGNGAGGGGNAGTAALTTAAGLLTSGSKSLGKGSGALGENSNTLGVKSTAFGVVTNLFSTTTTATATSAATALTAAAVSLQAAAVSLQYASVASSFDVGGYTGDGAKMQPAGVVHAGEFVITKEKTAQYRPVLEAIHNGSFGRPHQAKSSYATGGLVQSIAASAQPGGQDSRGSNNKNNQPVIINAITQDFVHQAMATAAGGQITLNHISKNSRQIRHTIVGN